MEEKATFLRWQFPVPIRPQGETAGRYRIAFLNRTNMGKGRDLGAYKISKQHLFTRLQALGYPPPHPEYKKLVLSLSLWHKLLNEWKRQKTKPVIVFLVIP
jgi:hypothetical protein